MWRHRANVLLIATTASNIICPFSIHGRRWQLTAGDVLLWVNNSRKDVRKTNKIFPWKISKSCHGLFRRFLRNRNLKLHRSTKPTCIYRDITSSFLTKCLPWLDSVTWSCTKVIWSKSSINLAQRLVMVRRCAKNLD